MLASDGDRDKTVNVLREAFAEGRLTQPEFEERLTQAHTARTYGDLAVITTDLPALPAHPAVPAVPERPSRISDNLRRGWASWVGVSVLVNVIWLATWVTGGKGMPYYWPIWVMGPWGAAMLIATLTGRAGDED